MKHANTTSTVHRCRPLVAVADVARQACPIGGKPAGPRPWSDPCTATQGGYPAADGFGLN
jgi:hypothetical protein